LGGRYKKGWSATHQKTFILYTQGVLPKDIAVKLGCGIDKIRNIIHSVKFQDKHATVETDCVNRARKHFEQKLMEAAGKVVRIMQGGKPEMRLQFDAAKEILYQCGMKPVEVIETRGREYTPEEIQSSLTVIKEVEQIEEKLASRGSGFLLQEKGPDEPSLSAPVLKAKAQSEEVIPADNNLTQGGNDGTVHV